MYILRIDDVGRRPEDSPEVGTDHDLTYFKEWREKSGLSGLPVIYAAVPKWLSPVGCNFLCSLSPPERVAVHGWDHHREEKNPTAEQMSLGRKLLNNTTTYVPPFNLYDSSVLQQWSKVGGRYFLGGYQSNQEFAKSVRNLGVTHLPAVESLYGRIPILKRELHFEKKLEVITLHVTWDALNEVSGFGNLIGPYLVDLYDSDSSLFPVESLPKLDRETAPHFLAYSWILNEISKQYDVGTVLDFGSRYSRLPTFLALRGFNVTACDRDEIVLDKQISIPREEQIKLADIWMWDGMKNPPEDNLFDAVVCCWSIQHNKKDEIPILVQSLISLLRSGGHLFLVGSYSSQYTHYQSDRADPQWILDDEDYQSLIIQPELIEKSRQYFWYQHSTPNGKYCNHQEANAICLHLRKK